MVASTNGARVAYLERDGQVGYEGAWVSSGAKEGCEAGRSFAVRDASSDLRQAVARGSIGPRSARAALAVAIGVFAIQGWWFAGQCPTWHEEFSTHASPAPIRLITESGATRAASICDGGVRIATTQQRPQVALCAGGLAWPILVTPYAVGVHYWPFQILRFVHHGHPIKLRRTILLLGAFALVALFFVVERAGDSMQAAVAVATAAVAPSFMMLHSVLVSYESAPIILLACATLVVLRRADPDAPLGPGRAAAAGALTALAVLGNIKAIVVGLPLLAFALFESPVLRRTPRRAWLAAALTAALVLLPAALLLIGEPGRRFNYEVVRRTDIAASRLDPRILIAEVLNGILFATDILAYGDMVSGQQGRLIPVTFILAGLAFAYSSAHLVRALRRKPHDRVAAGCGAIQIFFLIFVCLAYNQTPAANYSPIVLVQVVSIGCTVLAAGGWLARRLGSTRLAVSIMVAFVLFSLPFNSYRRGDPRNFQTISTNVAAMQALAEHLQREPEGTVVVTSYGLTGAPDSLTGRPSLSISSDLESCAREADAEACERQVIDQTISVVAHPRFLVPLNRSVIDKPSAWRASATIEAAARQRGMGIREEARFATGRGIAVLALLAIEPRADAVPRPH